MFLILKIWESKVTPSGFRDATIIIIYKKGDREDCNNYRSTLHLRIASPSAENVLDESQWGFQTSSGTIYLSFCACQFNEKCQEQRQPAMFIFGI